MEQSAYHAEAVLQFRDSSELCVKYFLIAEESRNTNYDEDFLRGTLADRSTS